MDFLGLLIFIAFVIFKVLGAKVTDMKDKMPKDWEKGDWPPFPKDWPFPWDDSTTYEEGPEAGRGPNATGRRAKRAQDWEDSDEPDPDDRWDPVGKDDKWQPAESPVGRMDKAERYMDRKARQEPHGGRLIPERKESFEEKKAAARPEGPPPREAPLAEAEAGRIGETLEHPWIKGDAVIQGIIFSEILQPPKSKRRR